MLDVLLPEVVIRIYMVHLSLNYSTVAKYLER